MSDLYPDRDPSASAGVRVRPAARPTTRIDEVAPSTALRPVDRAALSIRPGSADERTLRPGASARDLIVDDEAPTSAREACGKRRFIALAVCMDATCEEARFRATPECIGILSRKAMRENR